MTHGRAVKSNQKNLQKNLDSLKVPAEIEELFANKTGLISKMRALEQDMKSYLKSKVLNLKEDILAGNASVKRIVKVLVEVDSSTSPDSWSIKIQGRV